MFGINEIMLKRILGIELTEKDKFRILHSKKIDMGVIEYLKERLENLYIILGSISGDLFDLMTRGRLEGWCWETTESVTVFMNDDDYIERGNLRFDKKCNKYYHSWVCFKFNGDEYVLDPCFDFICKKDLYYKLFEIVVMGHVTAKEVKEALIKQMTMFNEVKRQNLVTFNNFLENDSKDSWEKYKVRKRDVGIEYDKEDPNIPLYRNRAEYTVYIEDGKIKKLTALY